MGAVTARSVDGKGRVTLGKEFANRHVIVSKLGEGVLQVVLAEVVPAREAWLYKNPEALASVLRGLQERGFAEAPDLAADADWLGDEDDA